MLVSAVVLRAAGMQCARQLCIQSDSINQLDLVLSKVTYIGWSNLNLFYEWEELRLVGRYKAFLSTSPIEKSMRGLDLGTSVANPCHPLWETGLVWSKMGVSRAVWYVIPSCWNHMFFHRKISRSAPPTAYAIDSNSVTSFKVWANDFSSPQCIFLSASVFLQ